MTSSTSLIISGSSAEVGSSNSMIFGCMASARAMATRCCWPPERLAGIVVGLLGHAHALEQRPGRLLGLGARAAASPSSGASMMFSSAVMWGKRLNDWNTMPTRVRSVGRFTPAARDRVAQHDDVALLDPLEPVHAADQRALARARRPAHHHHLAGGDATGRSSRSTWSLPNHLLTPLNWMAGRHLRGRCLHNYEDVPGFTGWPGCTRTSRHRPRRRRLELVLHLHGLDDDQRVCPPGPGRPAGRQRG